MSDQLSADLASLRIQRDSGPEGKSPIRSLAVAVVVLAALAGGGVYAYPYARSHLFKTEVAATEVALVSPVQASVALTSTGYVVPQTLSRVGAKRPGRVAKVLVKEGDPVKAGDVLVELDTAEPRAALAAASARVAAARARADAAHAQLAEIDQQIARERALVEKGATARSTLEDLEARRFGLAATAKAAQAEVHAASAELAPLRVAVEDGVVTSPIAGTVIGKPVELGELVGPEVPIVEVADFASLLVETDVPESRLHMIRVGGPCEIVLDAYPSKRYRGRAIEIGKRINRAKATVTVKVKFTDPAEGVLPEMSARVGFLTEELAAEAMKEPPKKVLPASALTERGGAKVVFVIDDGKVRMTPVTLGPAFGTGFELVAGPAPGARLVASPPAEMTDGQRIKEKGSDG